MTALQDSTAPLIGNNRPYDAIYSLASSRCAVNRNRHELALQLEVVDARAQPTLLLRLHPEQAADLVAQLQEHLALLRLA